MSKIKIEKNIPIPPTKPRGRQSPFPFAEMEVNDSFFFDNPKGHKQWNSPHAWRRKFQPDWKFVIRPENGGFRCWRVK